MLIVIRLRLKLPTEVGIKVADYAPASAAITATKRRQKSEADVLDRATNNLARALKQDMLKKNDRVDYEKLRREGYSERLLEKFEKA